jgi:hypothetical protein
VDIIRRKDNQHRSCIEDMANGGLQDADYSIEGELDIESRVGLLEGDRTSRFDAKMTRAEPVGNVTRGVAPPSRQE